MRGKSSVKCACNIGNVVMNLFDLHKHKPHLSINWLETNEYNPRILLNISMHRDLSTHVRFPIGRKAIYFSTNQN